jgi:hypothetical protein
VPKIRRARVNLTKKRWKVPQRELKKLNNQYNKVFT